MNLNAIEHILVIDDDRRIRNLLACFLQDNGYFVSTAANTKEARALLKEYRVNLMVVDVMMPDETGIEFSKKIRQTLDTPILMLTAMGDTEDRIAGLESGADDYLAKPFEPKELLLRIKRIIQRTSPKSQNHMVHFGNYTFNAQTGDLSQQGKPIAVTSNEVQLLQILTSHVSEIISREKLAVMCGNINERSVDVQITRLRNKIEADIKNPRHLKTVRGKGYQFHL